MTLRGLYVVTDHRCCSRAGLARLEAALRGGARLAQLRCKPSVPDVAWGQAAVALGRQFGVPVLANDDAAYAAAIGADGVHLGRDDGSIAAARACLGPRALIGASCYASLERARRMADEGADYLAFGRFYPSVTKPGAVGAPVSILAAARALGRPVVAIGGILPDNGEALLAAGADMLAVIDGVFGQSDIEAAARSYLPLFRSDDESES
ncbi:MAG: thiamine phosphate synthase [Gammaproteobacteria bacterium]|nr:thiamine phosphate synthase [Gammaproteobacteria bacterium]